MKRLERMKKKFSADPSEETGATQVIKGKKDEDVSDDHLDAPAKPSGKGTAKPKRARSEKSKAKKRKLDDLSGEEDDDERNGNAGSGSSGRSNAVSEEDPSD